MQKRKKFFRIFIWLVLVILVLCLIFERVGERLLRPVALSQLAELTGAQVVIKSVDFQLHGHVEMEGVSLGVARREFQCDPVFTADHVSVGFSFLSLLKFDPKIRRIKVDGFTIYIDYDSDYNQWNWGLLDFGKPEDGDGFLPTVNVRDGTLELSKYAEDKYYRIASIPVSEATIAPVGAKGTYGFSLVSGTAGEAGYRRIGGKWEIGDRSRVKIEGGVFSLGDLSVFGNSWDMRDLSLDVEYDADGVVINRLAFNAGQGEAEFTGKVSSFDDEGEYRLGIKASNVFVCDKSKRNSLVYDEGILEKLRGGLHSFLSRFAPEGLADFDVEARGVVKDFPRATWTGKIDSKKSSFEYEKFPYRLDHLKGWIVIEEHRLTLDDLECKHGDVDLEIGGYTEGKGETFGYDISIKSDNMVFDNDLYKSLNANQKNFWFTFAPTGLMKVHQRLMLDPEKGRDSELSMELIDAGAVYEHFPYPLANLTGKVVITPTSILLEKIVSEHMNKGVTSRVEMNGTVKNTDSDNPRFNINIAATDIPIDAKLMGALPARQREFYENFSVNALTDVTIKVFPNEVGKRLVEYIAEVIVKDATVKYEGFEVGLEHVMVRADLTPDKIILHEMVGQSNGGSVRASGDIWPSRSDDEATGYCLSLEGKKLDINEGWLDVLPERVKGFVNELRPAGRVNVTANLSIESRKKDCDEFNVTVDCLGGSVNYEKFPYPLENVTGQIEISEDKIVFNDLTAMPKGQAGLKDSGKVVLNGMMHTNGEGIDSGDFSFKAMGIQLDDVLADSLPAGGRKVYDGLLPSGKINLNVDKVKYYKDGKGDKWVDFGSVLGFAGCGFGTTQVVSEMDASLELEGVYKIGHGLWSGEGSFEGERMKIKNRLLEKIRTPIRYDPQEGIIACDELTAKCYGGVLKGNVSFKYSQADDMEYVLAMMFEGIDLQRIVDARTDGKEVQGSDGKHEGSVSGEFGVSGVPGDEDSKVGRLTVNIADMKLAKRSFFGKVLTAMKLGSPTNFLFNEVRVDSYVRRNKLVFEDILMIGESNVFRGEGQFDLTTDAVDLEFTAYGRDASLNPSMLESLARGLGGAIVKVEVTGDVKDPKIKTTTLPVIKGPLKIFSNRN